MALIEGSCEPGFERVREAFVANFAEHNELGAAVAVTVGGKPLVDLWGGWMDAGHTRPWGRETIVNVWSVGKAVSALCVLQLVERGLVELDAPVARYWPEFAQAGKAGVTVRHLLTHQAGLAAIAKPLPEGTNLTSWKTMVDELAAQTPWWEPGTAFGYHVNTLGFLLGELIRRTDGRSIGAYIREELGDRHGVDFLVGFGPEEDERVADWITYTSAAGEESTHPWLERDPASMTGIDLCRILAYRNPPGASGAGVNSRLWRAAEFPSTNPHSNARAIARVFGGLANGGEIDGRHLLSPPLIEQARQVESDGEDLILGRPNRFGLGFQLTIPGVRPLGPGAHTFGHYGNGGILGFADPDARIGFGYVCNRSGRSWRDPRNLALVDAVYASLAGA